MPDDVGCQAHIWSLKVCFLVPNTPYPRSFTLGQCLWDYRVSVTISKILSLRALIVLQGSPVVGLRKHIQPPFRLSRCRNCQHQR